MITLNLTEEKAKALLHCLIRTSAKGNELTLGMKIEDELVKLINKPSETTNEKPKIKTCICEWDKCNYVCRGKDDKYNINKQCKNTKKIIRG